MKTFPAAGSLALGLLLTVILPNRTPGQAASPTPTPAGPTWQQMQHYEQEANPDNGGGATAVSLGTGSAGTAANVANRFISRANDLQNFIAQNAGDPRISEAQRLEALMLVDAAYYGDASMSQRRTALVTTVRRDGNLSVDARCGLAIYADSLPLRNQAFATEAARLAQFEAAFRSIVAEFPTAPEAYECLLSFAKGVPEDESAKIVKDLLGMNAPAPIKADAQTLLNRFALEGQSLGSILDAVLPVASPPALAAGSITILYSWESWNQGSLITAQAIAANAPTGATVIGVNLDTNVAAATQLAAASALPGVQLYDPAGPNSAVAKALFLNGDAVVIITNRQGVIVTVSGQNYMVQKLAAANP